MQRLFLSGLFLAASLVGFAQNNPETYHALSARVLAVNFEIPNEELDELSFTYALELGYRRQLGRLFGLAVPLKIGVVDIGELENPLYYGADLLGQLYPIGTDGPVSPYLQAGIGIMGEGATTLKDADANHQVPLGGGLNFKLGLNSLLNFQGEYRMSNQDNRDNVQLGLGYLYRLSSLDSDQDGILNRDDACPAEAGPATTDGCPDTDMDGLRDRDDACPTLAGPALLNGCPDTDGDGITDAEDECPELAGVALHGGCPDTDEDGVRNNEDECPDTPGTTQFAGCPDTDGDGVPDRFDNCPAEAGPARYDGCPDTDFDGLPDPDDKCPEVAGVFPDGCPPVADRDEDGIPDAEDDCPTTAGPRSNQGCPVIREEVQRTLDYAAQAVEFETGRATLKESSYVILAEIAAILKEYRDYNLRISGHTDSIGSDTANQVLSEKRAAACREFLLATGIRADRISSTGYGESRPKADNSTRAGRQENRRVEFSLER